MTVNKPVVIDIYHGDPVEDFEAVKAFGIVGVIHKASEGTAVTDKLYSVRRKAFTDIGMKWGAYHFFHGLQPVQEADAFLAAAEPDADTLVALDWENWPSDYHAPDADAARKFLERIEDKLGRKAVIYSGNVAKEKIDGRDTFFGSHRLWLCQYANAWRTQLSWSIPWLWQNNGDEYGPGPHQIPGIAGNCDNNTIVTGTVDDLIAEWADGPAPVVA
jgi:GH25 family lysozyme M1 (1,4-beta-N-acetylmuramidase)